MVTVAWPLVGREAEQQRLHGVLASGGGALLVGPPGVGKTQLARAVLAQPPGGVSVHWAYGTSGASSIPLGSVTPLLPGPVTGRSQTALVQEARGLLEAAFSHGTVLAVDDAHLIDRASMALFGELGRRGRVRLFLTSRRDISEDLGLPDLATLELGPLTRTEVEAVVEQALGGPIDIALGRRLWQASAGNALFLRELVLDGFAQGCIREVDGAWRLTGQLRSSGRLSEAVEVRLAGLDATARSAAELIATAEPIAAAALAPLVPEEVLNSLVAGGVALVGGGKDLVQLAHPVYGEVLRDALPKLTARRLQRQVADALEAFPGLTDYDRQRIVRWRLDSGQAVGARVLVDTARRALWSLDVDLAERCAGRAYRQEPGIEVGLLYGDALAMAGKHEEAETVLRALEGLERTDEEIVLGAEARAHNLFHGLERYDDAVEVNLRAASRVERSDSRRRLACHRASFELYSGRPRGALRTLEPVLADETDAKSVEAVLVGSEACAVAGQFRRSLELIESLPDVAGPVKASRFAFDPDDRLIARLFIAVHLGHFDEVRRVASSAHGRAIDQGVPFAQGWCAHLLGSAAFMEGRLQSAQRWFAEAVSAFTASGHDPRVRMALAGVLHSAALRGDDDAVVATEAAIDRRPQGSWRQFESEVSRARAWAAVYRGDIDDATVALSAAAVALEATGSFVSEARLLHDLVRLSTATPAQAQRLFRLGELVEGELMACRAAHAQAFAERSWEAMEPVAARFDALGATLFAAEAAAAATELARRAGRARHATRLGADTRALLARCDPFSTPALVAVRVTVSLTARERETAVLAARGLSNVEIAERLGLSYRTVENHLARVFTKLGVERRAELADSLGLNA